jgi:hypothetical protein
MTYYGADVRRTRIGSTNLYFFSTRSSTFTVRPLQSSSAPVVITTDFALEHLWNRLATLAAGCLAFLVVAFSSAAVGARWLRSFLDLRRLTGRSLTPVIVRMRQTPQALQRWEAIRQRYVFYERDGREYSMVMHSTQMPLRLSTNTGLAVSIDSHSKPVLLDGDLRMLDFTDPERAALIAALAGETVQ